jgi:hypothetical protein
MRGTALAAASRTTMGYAKGRAASASLRATVLPGLERGAKEREAKEPGATVPWKAAVHDVLGNKAWKEAAAGEDEERADERAAVDVLGEFLREEAEREFELVW